MGSDARPKGFCGSRLCWRLSGVLVAACAGTALYLSEVSVKEHRDALLAAEAAVTKAVDLADVARDSWWGHAASLFGVDVAPAASAGEVAVAAGDIGGAETVVDPDTGFSVPGALRLSRSMWLYQWVESANKPSASSKSNGEEFSYSLEWKQRPAASSNDFSDNDARQTRVNPHSATRATGLTRRNWSADGGPVSVGGVRLGAAALTRLVSAADRSVLPTAAAARDMILPFPVQAADSTGSWSARQALQADPASGSFTTAEPPAAPRAGDLRVNYRASAPAGAVVIGALASDGALGPWKAPNGRELLLVHPWQAGEPAVSPDAAFRGAHQANQSFGLWVRMASLLAVLVGSFLAVFGGWPNAGDSSVLAGTRDEEAEGYRRVPVVEEVLITLYFAELAALVWVFRFDWMVEWGAIEAALEGRFNAAARLASTVPTTSFSAGADGEAHFSLRGAGLPFPLLVLIMVFVMGTFVELSKTLCGIAGLRVSRATVALGLTERPQHFPSPLDNPMTMKKFREQSWQFAIHILMSLIEVYLLRNELPNGVLMSEHTTELVWVPPPFPHRDATGEPVMKFQPSHAFVVFYAAQLAVWIYTGFVCAFLDERKKDFLVMMAHHVITVALVGFSASHNFIAIGLIVLWVHDVSDIFVDLLKITNYFGLHGLKGMLIVELSFASCLVAWVYFRLFQYPAVCLRAALVGGLALEAGRIGGDNPVNREESTDLHWLLGLDKDAPLLDVVHALAHSWHVDIPAYFALNALLWLLQVLHVWWFYLLVGLALRVAAAPDVKEIRNIAADHYEGGADERVATRVGQQRGENQKPKSD
ncbi:hypothetical protein FNF27_05590 [Cafeteria roenbergensis]|uniref:TLC domain-containing protein n=1 Tax=Cafeteria roenbergensis TaxID=33653 RepID=A0A5A8E5G2_CAFRO|nr:hypothetical protein FNF27_05590 [Cafeteria roenbergensis]